MMSEEVSAIRYDGSLLPKDRRQRPLRGGVRTENLRRSCTARPSAAVDPPQVLVNKESNGQQCGKMITPLVKLPPDSQLPRWSLRSMWELASILSFLHSFGAFLNIAIEFSAEELETALITPNSTLDDIHIPLLKAIPPIARMALQRATWVTVLCRKLKDWWHWVADGEIPIVASHGLEVEAYRTLDPGTRVLILKALCDIRVEQEDIRSYIDDSIKHGIQPSTFRKERIGGDSHGISYWYEGDPIIGHRLYREIRRIEVKKVKSKGIPSLPLISCQWETIATDLDEFQEVSGKLLLSENRTEAALGKRLKIDILPEVEKIHKRKERLLKKQHREAVLLDSFFTADGLVSGRSLRNRKPVTYTFDDYDRSINEAIKITKRRQISPEPAVRREVAAKPKVSTNGRLNGPSQIPEQVSYDTSSPKSYDYGETDGEHKPEPVDRNNRRRQRPQRYSEREFVEVVSDNEAYFESDDDIMGEAVYDDEYLRSRKQRKVSSSSEGDEEYRWDHEGNAEDEEEEEEDSLTVSEDTEELHRSKKFPSHSKKGARLRSVNELQSGLRRSRRATHSHVNYRQYELSDSESDSINLEKSNASDGHSDASKNMEISTESQNSQDEKDDQQTKDQPIQDYIEMVEQDSSHFVEKTNSPDQDAKGVTKRRFLDLNELAPGNSLDDGPST